jgi:CHASE2 domain-containing sensor protein
MKAFKVFSHDDLLGGNIRAEDIEGKIVLLGYLGPYEGYTGPLLNQDKFFLP